MAVKLLIYLETRLGKHIPLVGERMWWSLSLVWTQNTSVLDYFEYVLDCICAINFKCGSTSTPKSRIQWALQITLPSIDISGPSVAPQYNRLHFLLEIYNCHLWDQVTNASRWRWNCVTSSAVLITEYIFIFFCVVLVQFTFHKLTYTTHIEFAIFSLFLTNNAFLPRDARSASAVLLS